MGRHLRSPFWVVVAFSFSERGSDDLFITYRYGDNLHKVVGFVYNPGERVLSTTTPMLVLILAGCDLLCQTCPIWRS